MGMGAMRGRESLAVDFLCFIQTFVKMKMNCPLSNTEPTLFYSTAQKILSMVYIFKALPCKLYHKHNLEFLLLKSCFPLWGFTAVYGITKQDVSRGVLGRASLRTIKPR